MTRELHPVPWITWKSCMPWTDLNLAGPALGWNVLCTYALWFQQWTCIFVQKRKILKVLDARWLFRAQLLIPVLWIPAKENIQVSVVSQIFPWNVIFFWPQVHRFDTFCQASWSVIQKVCFDCTCAYVHACVICCTRKKTLWLLYAWGGQRFTSDVLLYLSLFCFGR